MTRVCGVIIYNYTCLYSISIQTQPRTVYMSVIQLEYIIRVLHQMKTREKYPVRRANLTKCVAAHHGNYVILHENKIRIVVKHCSNVKCKQSNFKKKNANYSQLR